MHRRAQEATSLGIFYQQDRMPSQHERGSNRPNGKVIVQRNFMRLIPAMMVDQALLTSMDAPIEPMVPCAIVNPSSVGIDPDHPHEKLVTMIGVSDQCGIVEVTTTMRCARFHETLVVRRFEHLTETAHAIIEIFVTSNATTEIGSICASESIRETTHDLSLAGLRIKTTHLPWMGGAVCILAHS